METLTRIESLCRRLGRGPAIRAIANERDVTVATIHNWLELVRGVPRSDWLPALVPAPRGGGGKRVEIDERFWDAFRTDYLRASEPSLTSCYDRTVAIARRDGWAIPNKRTLWRRVDEIPEAVLMLARRGRDATKAMYPAQERDRSMFHALEAVNADGHKWDVFVKWPDGKIGRPLTVAFQDLYSNMFLSWRHARSENKDSVRLAYGDMVMNYGIPDHCYLDNGRAFASKWLTGGIPNRYRFKVKEEEPDGIMTVLGTEVHWTTPYHGQAKPIERGFKDFADRIAKHPAFEGAYTGNNIDAKPENYGSRAIPIDDFIAIVDAEIFKHNDREGRRTKVCGGKFSFRDVFNASYATSLIRKASPEQYRMCMLMAEAVKPRRLDGAIHFQGNRYWNEKLLEHRGRPLTLRFDPENLHDDLAVYAQDGTLICVAELLEAAGFADTNAAREHAAKRNQWQRANREMLEAERAMSLAELVRLQVKSTEPEKPEAKIIRPMFNGNLAMKPAPMPEADEDAFDANFAKGLRLVRQAEDNSSPNY
jgi:transposase InsO family protein